jgi:mannose-1-phosphate guanylyltransferase
VRLRALVLAAGLGTRLRPLTAAMPKPLLPVAGQPILARTLRRLAAAGCEAAAINLHHGGEEIRRTFGPALDGFPLTYSDEPLLLGTLGAFAPLRGFFAGADLGLIVNGDSLCRWPVAELIRHHLSRDGALATLLLSSRADPAQFGGGVAVGRDGALLDLRPGGSALRGEPHGHHPGGAAAAGRPLPRRRVFAGAHVLSPRLLQRIAADVSAVAAAPADIVLDLYEPLLAEHPGCLASLTTGRHWHDLGTPRRYLAAVLDWAGANGHGRWISPAAEVSPAAAVRHSSVEAGCRVEAGARIEGAVLLPGARVGAGGEVRHAILGEGAELPAGGRIEGQLLAAGGQRADLW